MPDRIEGADAWNAMTNGEEWFLPDTPEDAAVFTTLGAGFVHDMEATEQGAQFKADTLAAYAALVGANPDPFADL
jgi:hypothetical protein